MIFTYTGIEPKQPILGSAADGAGGSGSQTWTNWWAYHNLVLGGIQTQNEQLRIDAMNRNSAAVEAQNAAMIRVLESILATDDRLAARVTEIAEDLMALRREFAALPAGDPLLAQRLDGVVARLEGAAAALAPAPTGV